MRKCLKLFVSASFFCLIYFNLSGNVVAQTPTTTPSAPQPGRLPILPQIGPVPPPYVPCNEIRFPEFHSLRPYQASPCNQAAQDLALFCGNDIILNELMEIEKEFIWTGSPLTWYYWHEGELQYPIPSCVESTDGDGVRWERCTFEIDKTRSFAVDLSNAYLPIMGNTEQVPNSVVQTETIDDAVKVNEYVSWYLNGINDRAEYPRLNMDDPDDVNKLVSYSGPLKKLLAFESQIIPRRDEIVAAITSLNCDPYAIPADPNCIRHDQVVACASGECYPSGSSPIRLSGLIGAIPPLRRAYNAFEDYWQDYLSWRNRAISRFFKYVPFSITEDRKGEADVITAPTQVVSADITLINVFLTDVIPADLFFAHMQESVELADILQSTFVAQQLNRGTLSTVNVDPPEFCDVRDIRSNPGDNLFAGEVSATVNYTAVASCDFIDMEPSGDGNACRGLSRNQPGATPADCVSLGEACEVWYGDVDCPTGTTCADPDSCVDPNGGGTGGGCAFILGGQCVPSFYSCDTVYDEYPCNNGYVCGVNCSEPGARQLDNTQLCSIPYYIRVGMITETPLANEAWSRLVAGPAGVFKRFAPKIDIGAPIEALLDLPAASPVSYSSSDGTVVAGNPVLQRPGSAAEIYFPHIGGIHQYFLKCIQTFLRPQGYGEFCPSGIPSEGILAGDCPPVDDSEIPDTYLGSFKENYFRIVNQWFGAGNSCSCSPDVNTECPNNLVNECYNYVVKTSIDNGVNAAWSLAIWAHESAASNYCANPQVDDFGYISAPQNNVLAQLDGSLIPPFGSTYIACANSGTFPTRMDAYAHHYSTGNCTADYNFRNAMATAFWWITGCGSSSQFGISWPTDGGCP